MNTTFGHRLYKNRRGASHRLSLPHWGRGPRQRRSGAFVNRRLETLLPALFHTACALSAPSGHLPLEGKAGDTRIPSSKKTARRPCETIHSPASSSRAQPRDLSCTAAICTHAPSLKRHLGASLYRLSLTHILPVCKKDPSTSTLMTRKKDGSSHILFHTAV